MEERGGQCLCEDALVIVKENVVQEIDGGERKEEGGGERMGGQK